MTRSRILVAGMLSRRDCQLSPSSKETNTARSVPAKSKPLRTGSSRTALMGSVDMGPLIVEANPINRCIGCLGVETPGIHQRDLAPGRECRRRHVSPVLAAVLGEMDEAVVRAGPNCVPVFRRRGDGVNDAAAILLGQL